MSNVKLNTKEKAAILMISLGKAHSARIYQHLSQDEIEQLTLAITAIRRVDGDQQREVMQEFLDVCLAQKYITEGGIDYARDVLESAIGKERAYEVINKLSSSLQVRPFDFVRKADPAQILNVLQSEHPQTIALTLSYLDPPQAASVLAELPPERQADIIARIANMGSTAPGYIKEAERILERKISSMGTMDTMVVGGIDAIVEIINSVDRGTEKSILEQLELHDPELADDIRQRLFVFEDIAKMSNQAIQRVLRDVENSELTIALKGAGEGSEVYNLIMGNVSKRLGDMIKDDMSMMGPVRVRDVEEAQQKIVNIIRKLEEAGEIVTGRGGDDVIV